MVRLWLSGPRSTTHSPTPPGDPLISARLSVCLPQHWHPHPCPGSGPVGKNHPEVIQGLSPWRPLFSSSGLLTVENTGRRDFMACRLWRGISPPSPQVSPSLMWSQRPHPTDTHNCPGKALLSQTSGSKPTPRESQQPGHKLPVLISWKLSHLERC